MRNSFEMTEVMTNYIVITVHAVAVVPFERALRDIQ